MRMPSRRSILNWQTCSKSLVDEVLWPRPGRTKSKTADDTFRRDLSGCDSMCDSNLSAEVLAPKEAGPTESLAASEKLCRAY
jgi:hypothetical protein